MNDKIAMTNSQWLTKMSVFIHRNAGTGSGMASLLLVILH